MSEELVPLLPEDFREVARLVAEEYRRELPLIPGAVEAVSRIAERWPLGLASSSNRSIIDLALERAGIADRFAVTVSSEEVGRVSPTCISRPRRPPLEAAARLGVEPSRAVAIEDSTNGLLAARAAGLGVVAIPNRTFPPADHALDAADVVLGSLQELEPASIEAAVENLAPRNAACAAGQGRGPAALRRRPASVPPQRRLPGASVTRPSPRRPSRGPRGCRPGSRTCTTRLAEVDRERAGVAGLEVLGKLGLTARSSTSRLWSVSPSLVTSNVTSPGATVGSEGSNLKSVAETLTVSPPPPAAVSSVVAVVPALVVVVIAAARRDADRGRHGEDCDRAPARARATEGGAVGSGHGRLLSAGYRYPVIRVNGRQGLRAPRVST